MKQVILVIHLRATMVNVVMPEHTANELINAWVSGKLSEIHRQQLIGTMVPTFSVRTADIAAMHTQELTPEQLQQYRQQIGQQQPWYGGTSGAN